MQSDINIVGIKNYLKPNNLPLNIEVLDEISSTNDYLKDSIKANGTLVVAKMQTNGKGRRGKTFLSNDGGIYMSLKLGFDNKEILNLLTPCVAVAVSKALEKTLNIETAIKWVNDIYVSNKKLSGILTEAIFEKDGELSSIIIGIGVNVNNVITDELNDIAISCYEITGRKHDRSKIIANITNRIFDEIRKINNKEFLAYYKQKSLLLGKEITVIDGNNTYSATALDIDDESRLVIEKDGEVKRLFFGEVSTKI